MLAQNARLVMGDVREDLGRTVLAMEQIAVAEAARSAGDRRFAMGHSLACGANATRTALAPN